MKHSGGYGVIALKKIGTIGLALALSVGQCPIITLSAADEPDKTVITEVEGLSEEISNQKLTVGTQESEIVFPESLTVNVVRTQEAERDEEKLEESEEEPEELEEDTEDKEESEEPVEEPEDSEKMLDVPETFEEIKEDIEDKVDVDEADDPEVVEEQPEAGEGDDDTDDASLITGLVDFVFPSITAYAAETEEEAEPEEELSVEAESTIVNVTWSLDPGRSSKGVFSSENPEDYFVYQSKIPEGYECQVELPAITVTIVDEEEFDFDEECIIDGVKIRVTAAKGVFPKGATLSVSKVSKEQEEAVLDAVEENESEEDVVRSYTFDIKVLDKDGNEIQPADASKVKVSFTLDEISDSTISTNIYHMKEDDTALTAEKLDVVKDGCTATAETDGFSLYALRLISNNGMYYVDEKGVRHNIDKYAPVLDSSYTWEKTADNDGWYVVNSDVVVAERIQVSGEVKLILCDGAKLEATKGITVSGEDNALTIYGQTDGSGELIAKGENDSAGIGGGYYGSGNNITINGGTVTATGGEYGAGIGGGFAGAGNNITINGGTVTASGGKWGAGIGGGDDREGNNITINGGIVTASGVDDGAGIGGGDHGAGNNITINGGTVTASGGEWGAGIGGGYVGNGRFITISGGKVTANGGKMASGIGGGSDGAGNNITISGGTVTASGGDEGAGIGGGSGRAGDNITINGGTVTASGGKWGAGIGGGAIGVGDNITISGGTVTASGGLRGAGIGGGGYGAGNNITISGGTVTASGGAYGAGIGGGERESGDIKISGSAKVSVAGGYSAEGIGSGEHGAAPSVDKNGLLTSGYIREYKAGTNIYDFSDSTLKGPTLIGTATHLVHFYENGGSGTMSTQVLKDDNVTLNTNSFYREYYNFVGWNTKNDGSGVAYADEAKFTISIEELHLYAQWTPTQYTITYDLDGGKGVTSQTYTYEDTFSLKTPTKTNYKFKGWKVDTNSGSWTGTVSAMEECKNCYGNVTLVAQWKQPQSNLSVSITDWTYGETANSPSISNNQGTGEITYEYKVAGADDSTYTTTVPTDAGSYTVRATVAESDDYLGGTATADFTIEKAAPTINVDSITKIYDEVEVTSADIVGSAKYLGTEVPGTFTFKNDESFKSVSDSGEKTVIFTPDDAKNYETVETTLKLTINRKIELINNIVKQENIGGGNTNRRSKIMEVDIPTFTSVTRNVNPPVNYAESIVPVLNNIRNRAAISEAEELPEETEETEKEITDDKVPTSGKQSKVDPSETIADDSTGNWGLIFLFCGIAVAAGAAGFFAIRGKSFK